MKHWLQNIGLLGFSALSCLILCELCVRYFFSTYDPTTMIKFYVTEEGFPLGKKNSSGHQWMKAGDFDVTVRFNQYGLRDEKDLQRSTKDDIFVVGDSFSFGHGVDEHQRYSNILEEFSKIPVYNISIPTNFDGYEKLTAYAKRQGATIHTLLVGICMENDLQAYAPSPPPSSQTVVKEDNTSYYNNVTKAAFFKLKIYLGGQSALYNLLISLFHQNTFFNKLAITLGIIDNYHDGINRVRYSEKVLERSVQRLQRFQSDQKIPHMFPIIIPSRALWIGENRETERKVHNRFVELLQQAGYQVIDLLPAFEAAGNPLQFHFEHDGHWNTAGHRQAAETIFDQLQALKNL